MATPASLTDLPLEMLVIAVLGLLLVCFCSTFIHHRTLPPVSTTVEAMTDLNPVVSMRPLSELTPHPENPRQGDVGAIAQSLTANGQYAPIVARPDGTVLAGCHRLAAAKSLGWEEMLVSTIEVSDETARRIVLADNRTSDLASYDDHNLQSLLMSLAENDTLDGTGWDLDDLDDLNALLEESLTDSYIPNLNSNKEDTAALKVGTWEEGIDSYKDRAVRSIILDLHLPLFEWFIAASERARGEMDVETNTDLIVALLKPYNPDPAPE